MNRRQFSIAALACPLAYANDRRWQPANPGRVGIAIVPPDAQFMKKLPRLMEVAKLPGVGIGVVQNGRLVWEHYAGLADNVTGRSIDATTLFPAASLGKPVFAHVALGLVDEGKLALDRPLREYLTSDVPSGERESRITARHVLCHASGLPNWRRRTEDPYVSAFEPGTGFQYSGEGYYLLQRAVEVIAGAGAEQLMLERMVIIGMTSSTYLWREDAPARIAHGHGVFSSNPSNAPDYRWWEFNAQLYAAISASGRPLGAWRHEEILKASRALGRAPLTPQNLRPTVASSLLTTVADYSAFVGQVVSPERAAQPLSATTRDAMVTPASRVNSVHSWSLGWGLEQLPDSDQRFLWHWGDNGGIWKNFVLAHPPSQSAIVVFSNGTYGMHVVERIVGAATQRDLAAFLWTG